MKPNLSITLGVAWSTGNAQLSSSDKVLSADLRQKIFERDDHTCQFCGFKAQKYQEIHFLNGNHKNTHMQNMTTSCMFCAQCFDLDHVATMRSGVLIWLPEISQTALHHIARAIYVARISQGPMAEAARRSLDIMMQRREEARSRLGTDDPYVLSSVLRDYISAKTYEAREDKLEGLRLFPLDRRIIKEADLEFNQFPQILAYWRSKDGPFGGKIPNKWVDIYKQITLPKAA
ncbi:MAG: HNH endonuclease [Rhodospirillales bacterium]|nr:HNH endonuclease [Rhodospirillales bacterium]